MHYTIALGGNLGNPQETFKRAFPEIERRIGPLLACAQSYWTRPLVHPHAPVRQQLYLNTAVLAESTLTPEQVLAALLDIECTLGRVRANEQIPWGPRTIDLDLIAAGDTVVSSPTLSLPHPEMQKRDFVLIPMSELQPEWQHPVLGLTVQQMIDQLEERWIVEPLGSARAAVSVGS